MPVVEVGLMPFAMAMLGICEGVKAAMTDGGGITHKTKSARWGASYPVGRGALKCC